MPVNYVYATQQSHPVLDCLFLVHLSLPSFDANGVLAGALVGRYGWVNSATAFSSVYNDTGVLGIHASADAAHVGPNF